jgi:hypothetical protein
LKSYVAANELANSALLPGQNNVGFHILTTNEIFQKLRSDPANANVPDADIAKTAAQQGFYSGIGTAEHVPNALITPGETGMTFDRTKNSIVLNADALRDRMVKYRQTPIDALWHELSHYLFKVPEFKKLMENVESSLFSTEVKDISGKIIASTSGIYSPKDLVDMYRKSYMQGHDAPSIESLAKLSGVWDESRGTLDEQKVANYMREEVMADLFGEAGQRNIASTMDGGKRSIIENAIVKTKQLILDKALARFRGLGGKGDVVRAANSGAEFSPEVMKAAKNALDAMRDLNGAISPAIEAPAKPLISKAQMAKSKAIAGRYGIDSGLFETKMTASAFDANGNKIGESMLVSDVAFEGAFQSTPEGLKQLSGYGSLPNELTGVNIPEGGKIVVGKEFVMSPDGKTPVMLSSADVKKAVKGRSNLIRTALSEHDDGSPATFRAVSDDGLTFRGTFNPEQIKAIQNLPESIVPRSIKENILKANESIAAADGTRWIADYAAMMDDNGKYKAFSPKLYDFVPIGMHFSKDGNFLLTAINVGRIFQKMRLWNERMPGKLKMWDNNLEMAFDDFANIYLQNWKNGRPGETGLDKNPTIALVKKNIFNDLLNVTKEQYNPDISIIPRRKGDPRGKNLDRVITSFRVDHIAEMIKNEEATKLPVNYGFAKINFMPERMDGEVAETKKPVTQSERPAEERIVSATYTDPRTGEVREGVNHKAANPNAPDEQTDRESRYYGFKTDTGRVVDREEAYRIAEASGQLKEATSEEDKFNADRGVLHSNMVEMEPTIREKTEISPKIDADYMKAVDSGDIETQQKLVDDAAKASLGFSFMDSLATQTRAASGVADADKQINFYQKILSEEFTPQAEELAVIAAEENKKKWIENGLNPDDFTPDQFFKALGLGLDPIKNEQDVRQTFEVNRKGASENIKKYEASKSRYSGQPTETPFKTGESFVTKVYHATPFGRLTTFDAEKLGSFTGAPSATKAHFFAGDPEVSETYFGDDALYLKHQGFLRLTGEQKTELIDYLRNEVSNDLDSIPDNEVKESALMLFEDLDNYDTTPIENTLHEVYVALKNPLVYDFKGSSYREQSFSDLIDQAIQEERDGVVFANTFDPGPAAISGSYSPPTNVIAVIAGNETKIKSADPITYDEAGNVIPLSQRFNPKTSDIRFMPERPQDENIKPADLQTSATNVRSKTTGELSAQPVMVVMPQLDPQKIQEASNVLQNLNKPTK